MLLYILIILIIILYIHLLYKKKEELKYKHKNLVFTSAGDKTNFIDNWLNNNNPKTFDLWVVYYGDSKTDKYKKESDYWNRRKGSKFQNFHYVYNTYPHIINTYKKIFLLDDDIIFDKDGIKKCFEMSYKYDLWMLQPSFKKKGKISYPITIQKSFSNLRYSNFVEVNTPLIDKYVLKDIMKLYDPSLVGWGIDFLISWVLINHPEYNKYKIAILDNVSCINPYDNIKGGVREIAALQSNQIRQQIYKDYANKKKILFSNEHIQMYN